VQCHHGFANVARGCRETWCCVVVKLLHNNVGRVVS
jgi:hypothetical protein